MKAQDGVDPKELRRARKKALTFAAITVLSLLLLVYGFIQKTNAEVALERASALELALEEYRIKLEECRSSKEN